MTVLEPFCNTPVNLDITNKNGGADSDSRITKIRSAVFVRDSGLKHSNWCSVCCNEISGTEVLLLPYEMEKRFADDTPPGDFSRFYGFRRRLQISDFTDVADIADEKLRFCLSPKKFSLIHSDLVPDRHCFLPHSSCKIRITRRIDD